MPKIFISTSSFAKYDAAPLKLLQDAGMDVQINPHGRKLTPEECQDLYKGIDGLIAGTEALTRDVLTAAVNLKVISRCGAGTDNVDREAAEELGIKVLATPDAPTQAVAELTVGLMLNLLRRINAEDRSIRDGGWPKQMGNLLSEKTVGILGLGRIGRKVAELTQPFSPEYLAWDKAPDRQFVAKHNIKLTSLDELLGNANIVTIHLPNAPELKGVIGEREIALMKAGAFLINTARGELVDETALCGALREKRLAGAALDVFTKEPYGGPLTGLENVILTSHIGSYAREARINMETQSVENLIRGLKQRDV